MATSNQSQTFTSSSKSTLNIPSNAKNIKIYAAGGGGGDGGNDSDTNGGDGKNGTDGNFTFKSDYEFLGFTLEIWVGKAGEDGDGNAVGKGGGDGGAGGASGGDGADAAPFPYSGGGGGGGGASVVRYKKGGTSKYIVVAAGGGGGGGASRNNKGQDGSGAPNNFSNDNSISISGGGDGSRIDQCNGSPNDGGGGGGGGGGAPGGGGGSGGSDDNFCDEKATGGGGGTSKYSNTYLSKGTTGTTSGDGEVTVTWKEVTPEIADFYFDPNPSNSPLGTPVYSSKLYWSGSDYDWAGIRKTKKDGVAITRSYDEVTSSPITITLNQTKVGTNSPRSWQYQLKLCAGGENGNCVTEKESITYRNDNTPSNSWTKKFEDLEPLETPAKLLGTLAGVDMPTIFSSSNSSVQFSKVEASGFDNPKKFNNGDNVYIRFTTKAFNTDVSGLTVSAEYGKTNSKKVTVTPGGGSDFDVEYVTRAPKIKETFNYGDETGYYPEPDIDLINNSSNIKENMITNTHTVDEIEIPMPIRSTNSNIQVSINNGTFKNIENLSPKRV